MRGRREAASGLDVGRTYASKTTTRIKRWGKPAKKKVALLSSKKSKETR